MGMLQMRGWHDVQPPTICWNVPGTVGDVKVNSRDGRDDDKWDFVTRCEHSCIIRADLMS
jgi:hypothetical protein